MRKRGIDLVKSWLKKVEREISKLHRLPHKNSTWTASPKIENTGEEDTDERNVRFTEGQSPHRP